MGTSAPEKKWHPWRTVFGIAMLLVAWFASEWLVKRYTPPGHTDVIAAQAMDMSAIRPSTGAAPVTVSTVVSGSLGATVTYTGEAHNEASVMIAARVDGTLTEMPWYPGMHVNAGDLLARIDPRELDSRVQQQIAALSMSRHEALIAGINARAALATSAGAAAAVDTAKAEEAQAEAGVANARAEAAAALSDVSAAEAALTAAKTGTVSARAGVKAAAAAAQSAAAQASRMTLLVGKGVVSQRKADVAAAENADAQARLTQATDAVATADASVASAAAQVARARAMAKASSSSVSAALQAGASAQAKVRQARAAASAARQNAAAVAHEVPHTQAAIAQSAANLNTASIIAGYTVIRAPFSGVVTDRDLAQGALVQAGAPILDIAQNSMMRLQANVAQSDAWRIRPGDIVTVDLPGGGAPISTRVSTIFPIADPTAHTSVVEALVPNPQGRIRSGDFVTMHIQLGEARTALLAPLSAIVKVPVATTPVLATGTTAAVWTVVEGKAAKTIWTCSMHPQIRENHPGKCPI
ncbi:MAG: efflux RND transporter periplasmic adaptor subunit [Armatimonadetes bacterium]|nr:efflux RND transporter periplasmic adaptor subunit [Armatimonadota bacterium]MDE2206544.1 efflux RND transporter periplasmic adaptor subunit [Armatimonadota bacterium]